MATFEEALTAARTGRHIRVKGTTKWMRYDKDRNKIIADSVDFGYTPWVPHQWEILDAAWEIK